MQYCFKYTTQHRLFQTESKRLYYSTVLCHALAPKSSFFALLDALWHIHSRRVDDTYSEEDYADIADAFKAFFSRSNDENAGISVGSLSYAIRTGLRYCALQDRKLFIDILKRAFGLLSLYYDNGGEDDENRDKSYFVQLFEEWYHDNQSTLSNEKKRTVSKREPSVRDYKTAKIKYAFNTNNNSPFLAFPQKRLFGYSEDRPIVIVKCGEQVVEKRFLELCGDEFLRSIRPFNIDLTKYTLQNLDISLKIILGEEVLYDSQNEFERALLIFSGEKEIVGNRIEKGYYTCYYLGDGDDIFSTCREIAKHTYRVKLEVGDDFEINGKTYHIIDGTLTDKNEISNPFIGHMEKGVKYILGDEEISVYSALSEINLGNHDSHNLRFEINGKNYASDHFSISDCTKDDHCFIRIWDSANFETQYKCIFIKGFQFSFDQKYYYDKHDYPVLEYVINEKKEEKSFRISDERIETPYLEGMLEFYVPSISWIIPEVHEKTQFTPNTKPIWHEKIKQNSILKISAPSNVNIEAYNSDGALKPGSEIGTFLIGQAIWGNENKQTTGLDEIYSNINGERINHCKVAYYPQITQKPQIKYNRDSKTITVDYSTGYIGLENAQFCFEFDNGNVLSFKSSNCPASYELPLEKDSYKFRMYWLKQSNSFGFGGSPKKVMIYESDFSNGKPEEIKFAKKTLKISEYVDFNNVLSKLGIEYYLSKIRYHGRSDGFDQYSCEISRNTRNGPHTLFNGDEGYIEIIKNGECLLYYYDEDYENLSEFIFRKADGFIYKEQGDTPTSRFASYNYLKYEEVA